MKKITKICYSRVIIIKPINSFNFSRIKIEEDGGQFKRREKKIKEDTEKKIK